MKITFYLFEQDYTESDEWAIRGTFATEEEAVQLMECEKGDRIGLELRPRRYKIEQIYE